MIPPKKLGRFRTAFQIIVHTFLHDSAVGNRVRKCPSLHVSVSANVQPRAPYSPMLMLAGTARRARSKINKRGQYELQTQNDNRRARMRAPPPPAHKHAQPSATSKRPATSRAASLSRFSAQQSRRLGQLRQYDQQSRL